MPKLHYVWNQAGSRFGPFATRAQARRFAASHGLTGRVE